MRKKLLDRDSDDEKIWGEGGEFYGEGIFQYKFDATVNKIIFSSGWGAGGKRTSGKIANRITVTQSTQSINRKSLNVSATQHCLLLLLLLML